MAHKLVYITFPTEEEAEKIGATLIESRLAACINILPKMMSLYWWQGKIQKDSEVVLIAKTRDSLVIDIIEKVKALHSYDCPCIVSLPLEKGNLDFLNWITEQTE